MNAIENPASCVSCAVGWLCAVAGRVRHGRTGSRLIGGSNRRSMPRSARCTRSAGSDVFHIFRQYQPERGAVLPPRLVAPSLADHRIGDQRDIGHRVRHFHDGARHVVVRGHHDQRLEAALMRPAPRLRGIAAGGDRRAVEIDTAIEQRLAFLHRAGNVVCGGGRMHARDQEPLAVAGGQQFHRVRDARGSAGQHHDAVGLPFGPAFRCCEAATRKPMKPNDDCATNASGTARRRAAGQRGARADAVRRFIVGLRESCAAKNLPCRILTHDTEACVALFRADRAPGPPLSGSEVIPIHSMSSRVANSVRRDAQAVIAAIMTACTASTR